MSTPSNSNTLFNRLHQRIFKTLSIRYLIALSTIAFMILLSNLLIQHKLHQLLNDSRVINVAGRQSMLSQRLSNAAIKLKTASSAQEHAEIACELQTTLELLTRSHAALLNSDPQMLVEAKNSEETNRLYQNIDPAYSQIVMHGYNLYNLLISRQAYDTTKVNTHINAILSQENVFLSGMDAIVNQYDLESRAKVDSLIEVEQTLMLIALGIILLEVIFIFRPLTLFIKKIVYTINRARTQAKNLAQDKSSLLQSLQESQKKLSNVYSAIEQTTLFAKADAHGNLTHVSSQFLKYMEYPTDQKPVSLTSFLQITPKLMQQKLHLVENHGSWNGDVRVQTFTMNAKWINMTILPVRDDLSQLYEFLFLSTDITQKKEAQFKLQQVKKEKRQQKLYNQRMQSILIINAQEKERKHIAMELHDNIGQSITALKYYVEALHSQEKAKSIQEPLNNICVQLQDTIKNVRSTSFSLMPSVLEHYGIASVLNNFAGEMQRITGQNIVFVNKDNFDQRLHSTAETNLYRIAQECVNNALKYAQASLIEIILSRDSSKLFLEVIDDGSGFNLNQDIENPAHTPSGHGISNMQERTKYLMGKFAIYSRPGQGTRVLIQVPLNKNKHFIYGNSITS
ncbi:sensor histidine kinase [Catalinimonas niigatensis]|uniref:sensor histidine kinase n=1 Tax=Catalinimonas niigatensis TaxID=1397264 RepID=UPI0026660D54|nr:ATP-binding protein [Catalinimonas niigatensis]WPP50314.1 type IV pili methyl-accepting chemotaxis transducer N-terminal domain-containing protein [Catalinimonas niigatensis]